MSDIKIALFGRFKITQDGDKIQGIQAGKVQELFGYLLVSRERPQSREVLSELLWGDEPPARSKKNLRQTLWRLQSVLKMNRNPSDPRLIIEDDWIQLNPAIAIWLDIAEFEQIFASVNGKRARELSLHNFDEIQRAINLYSGDLLEGWYQDWCIIERERLQRMHLMFLDKLVQYCEVHRDFDRGLAYGAEILRCDRAYERTHRQMMRLHFMAGDRTQALQQYQRCAAALREELDVEPSDRTKQLYEQIRSDTFAPPLFAAENTDAGTAQVISSLGGVLNRLARFSETLAEFEGQVQKEILALENTLSAQE